MSIDRQVVPKGANEVVTYCFDFSRFPEFAAGATLVGAAVTADAGITVGPAAVTAAAFDNVAAGRGATAAVSGGTAGRSYDAECLGTFSDGSVRAVRARFRVE